jgi:hypothetical protein
MFSLYIKTDPWPEHAQYIRHRFEINRFLTTPEDVEAATSAGDTWLRENWHPDLYVGKMQFPYYCRVCRLFYLSSIYL